MTTLNISGMMCGHCQNAVKSVLESVLSVQHATVDLATGAAKVESNPEVNALVAAVEGAGYQAAPANQ